MTGYDNRQALIEGISERLQLVYAAELICLVLGHWEASHWYNARREGLHKELTKILEHEENKEKQ